MAEEKLPTFQFTFDESDVASGIKCVSLVDVPAIDSKAFFFNKENRKAKFVKIDGEEYEGKVAGLLLRHSYPILRQAENGDYYNGEFSQEVVKELQQKFHKELQSNNVNTGHDDDAKVDAYMVEDFIISTEELLSHVKAKGIEEAQIGDWYGVYQIDNAETFQKVVDGELTGFSIEAYLDVAMRKLLKNNNDFQKLFNMDKKERSLLKKIFDFMSSKIEDFEDEVTNDFESELVPEENWTINWTEVGAEVTKTYMNEADEEVTEAVDAGTYTTESGIQIVVGEDGMLAEVIAAEPVVEDEPVAAAEEAAGDSTVAYTEVGQPVTVDGNPAPEGNITLDSGVVLVVDADGNLAEIVEAPAAEEEAAKLEAETEVETEVEAEETVTGDIKALLDGLLGQHEDGEFYLSVYKQDGEYKWGSVSMYKDLKLAKEVEDEKAELLSKIEKLEKEVGEQPAADPALGIESKDEKPVDTKNMSAYERLVAENGWENAPVIRKAI